MRFLDHRHHAEAEQVHFDDAHIGAIFFIPLDDEAAGHGRRLQGHDGIELAVANHHAAGMLAQDAAADPARAHRAKGIFAPAAAGDPRRLR